jgi:hypothetical protein
MAEETEFWERGKIPSMSLPEIILATNRRKVASIAQAMLDGEVGIIKGSRQLAGIRQAAGVDPFDPDFLPFVGIDSETDHLPIGDVRCHWASEALMKKDDEIAASEAYYREYALSACSRLVTRFANEKPSPADYDYYTPEIHPDDPTD